MKRMSGRLTNKPIVIKFSGGLTAQLLALMSSIYLSKKLNRPFTMRYFPYSTGTYWPLGIGPLLLEGELEETRETRGISYGEGIAPGSYIADFPLRRKGPSYEGFLQIIHKFGLDQVLRRLRGEFVIGAKLGRLKKVPVNVVSVSGNFPPMLDDNVVQEMSSRIDNARLTNPFKVNGASQGVVIHYRLGDMRKMPARNFKYGGHGVVDPMTFWEIAETFGLELQKTEIRVVSDEPEIAARLLAEVGFTRIVPVGGESVWADLATIASAGIFMGSASQFSAFGAIICKRNGGKIAFPSSNYGSGDIKNEIGIDDFFYFDYRFLKPDHWLFKL